MQEYFLNGLREQDLLAEALLATLIITGCFLAFLLARRFVLRGIEFFVKRSSVTWDDVLLKRGVFDRLAWLAPAVVVYYSVYLFPDNVEVLIQRWLTAYMILVVLRVAGSFLTALNDIYNQTSRSKEVPIKGYLQVIKLLVYLAGGMTIFAVVLDRSPVALLSGLGALTAILLLVFKDTILSFVASIQLATNDMVRLGDWITMPQFGADGDVVDIALHTVKVQNWDKTITTIPTHKFIEESFKNWRGMQSSGGRRIKRAVHIDQSSVHFLAPEEIERLSRIHILRPYIEERTEEIRRYNEERGIDPSCSANGRRMTNLGTLRAYLVRYLRAHPKIHQEMTFLVRQLEPGPTGLPLEIYVFTNDTRWTVYEDVQSDIFDHLLATIPEFGLRVFQNPSGHDFAALAREPLAARSGPR